MWWILTFVSLFQTLHFIPEKAISWLIRFLSFLMKFMGKYSPRIMQIAEALPRSTYQKNKFLNDDSKSVCRYVVCCACHSTFLYEQCLEKVGSRRISRRCPKTLLSRRCNNLLLKNVVSNSGHGKLYLFKVYCYKSLVSSLNKLMLRPGFADLCESTREYVNHTQSHLYDIYNGHLWKDFLHWNGQKN